MFKGLSFNVEPGNVLEIRGRNGAGKTSLLRMLAALVVPIAGRIVWRRTDIAQNRAAYVQHLSYVAHQNALKDDLSALENLQVACALRGGALASAKALDALGCAGLSGREHLPSRLLSQGQRRRVALARLAVDPRPLWLLDEPTAALDASAQEHFGRMLQDHVNAGGIAVVVSHSPLCFLQTEARILELA